MSENIFLQGEPSMKVCFWQHILWSGRLMMVCFAGGRLSASVLHKLSGITVHRLLTLLTYCLPFLFLFVVVISCSSSFPQKSAI
jgi:hypothetical protein